MQYTYLARNKKEATVELEESGICVYIWSRKKGEQRLFYPYEEVKRVHLSMPDLDWYTLKIRFSDKREVLLRSLTFGRRENELVSSKPEKHPQAYRELVLALHQKLLVLGLTEHIRFRQGNSLMALLSLGMAAACLLVFIPMAWYAAYYWRTLFFIVGSLVLILFSFRTGFERAYNPRNPPANYLPKNSKNGSNDKVMK